MSCNTQKKNLPLTISSPFSLSFVCLFLLSHLSLSSLLSLFSSLLSLFSSLSLLCFPFLASNCNAYKTEFRSKLRLGRILCFKLSPTTTSHIMHPIPVRSRKLTCVEPAQYWDGGPPGNCRCCKHFFSPSPPRSSCFFRTAP